MLYSYCPYWFILGRTIYAKVKEEGLFFARAPLLVLTFITPVRRLRALLVLDLVARRRPADEPVPYS